MDVLNLSEAEKMTFTCAAGSFEADVYLFAEQIVDLIDKHFEARKENPGLGPVMTNDVLPSIIEYVEKAYKVVLTRGEADKLRIAVPLLVQKKRNGWAVDFSRSAS